jgi:hypothetical protein
MATIAVVSARRRRRDEFVGEDRIMRGGFLPLLYSGLPYCLKES